MADLMHPDRDDIQGNILEGFNKDHMTFVFFSIVDPAAAKAWLGDHLSEIATVHEVQAFNRAYKVIAKRRRKDRKARRAIEATWVNIAFSAPGLAKLGTDVTVMPPDFQQGLAARAGQLGHIGPSAVDQWDTPFADASAIDGVLIIAADADDDRNSAVADYSADLGGPAFAVVASWTGEVRAEEPGREHFGFKDGISQPGIEGSSKPLKPGQDPIKVGEFVLGYENQSGVNSLDLPAVAPPPPPDGVYPPDAQPPAPASQPGPEWMRNGSYLVLEKLRQDVPGFNAGVEGIAKATGLPPELAGAKLVGRHKSGCPLEEVIPGLDTGTAEPANLDETEPGSPVNEAHINDFGYQDKDPDGRIVPRAAHIRKSYPRDQSIPGEAEAEKHRILRRGIPFGASFAKVSDAEYGGGSQQDGTERGLLFGCYQASIADQFEFIQERWVNEAGFPQGGDGVDPILNESVEGPGMAIPSTDPSQPAATAPLRPWVFMKGGGYFFSPGIKGLAKLAGKET